MSTTAAGVLIGCAGAPRGAAGDRPSGSAKRAGSSSDDDKDDDVTPAEDLMREHGVLRRVMYLYDDAAMRLDGQRDVPLDALAGAAGIIRRVIEDYHEKLEEDLLFPRFERAGVLAELTAILRRQHAAGRVVTAQIASLARAPLHDSDRAQLAAALRRFNHMYRPHAAREDTVLFPAIRALVGGKAYEELGEQFEDKERSVLGDHGFEHAVGEIGALERAFGLDDLERLTA